MNEDGSKTFRNLIDTTDRSYKQSQNSEKKIQISMKYPVELFQKAQKKFGKPPTSIKMPAQYATQPASH